ncbi:DUF2254 domain-containing protein [Blastococcus sp. TF02-8]|uniref:DUF2254 domain-containing protein n=1 Tax=Blastococcus sp. TF02-8 TaxID=2250574 RepID=UPI00197AFA01|nr:DUF2254 domain-containing protein [Blastococcus sp. TF02-8]
MPLPQLRIAAALYRFRESLFFLPALLVVLGAVLAEAAAAIDRGLAAGHAVPLTLDINSNAATWLLSTVAGATITTAGVVFSLTVVSLQLASSQFSPRVMRSFIRDRLSQVVIGLLIATFVFSVLTLRHIDDEPATPAPRISMTMAIALTVTTVLLIVAHLDHLARGLQVGQVVRTIAAEGELVIDALVRSSCDELPGPATTPPDSDGGLVVPAPRDGWVTQAPSGQILAVVPPRSTVRFDTRNGAYIHEGEPLVTIWPVPADADAVCEALARTVLVADTRTMQEDVDFAIRQLVDIGLRALSSAINDPTTAVEVTLRLGSLLRKVLVIELPPRTVAGPDGKVLLRPWDLSHEEYIAHAFDQLRQAAPPQSQVAASLLRVLRMLQAHVGSSGRPELVPALQGQIDRLMDAVGASSGLPPADVSRLAAIAHDPTDPAEHSGRAPR